MICPSCGREVPKGSNFCAYCGYRLQSSDEPPALDATEVIRNVLIQRIEGIKKRDAQMIESLVYKEKYTKFDDWPPFELQDSNALRNEAAALKVLKEYEYETRSWKIEIFDNSAIAMFMINYRGKIRDLDFNVRSRITAFLVKIGNDWKIVHENWSRFPTAVEAPSPPPSPPPPPG